VATETRQIVLNLLAFYDFTGKTVVAVGAGGGQLAEYARPVRQVIAVDRDANALARLAARLPECGLADKFRLVAGDLLDVSPCGDVVMFEFCLHEMADPDRALAHARRLAPDVLVIDHAPGSLWSWHAAEDGMVEAGWKAVERRVIRRERTVDAWQRFADYAELEAKLAMQGPSSVERIESHRGQTGIAIPMPYRLALL
jgi:ubiquinone/menaquinone biosynthesis C-methylase UbiE